MHFFRLVCLSINLTFNSRHNIDIIWNKILFNTIHKNNIYFNPECISRNQNKRNTITKQTVEAYS